MQAQREEGGHITVAGADGKVSMPKLSPPGGVSGFGTEKSALAASERASQMRYGTLDGAF